MLNVKRKFGFTLVELLVVISIIAILLAVLMPSLSRARAQAAFATCGARLKNFHLAYMMYAQENNNRSVPSAPWSTGTYDRGAGVITKKEAVIRTVIDSYINKEKKKSLWECPADRGVFKIYDKPEYSSYSYNFYILSRKKGVVVPSGSNWTSDHAASYDLSIFSQPAKTSLFSHGWVQTDDDMSAEDWDNGSGWYYPHKYSKDRTSRGYFSIYLDGHCKQMAWRDHSEESGQMEDYYKNKINW